MLSDREHFFAGWFERARLLAQEPLGKPQRKSVAAMQAHGFALAEITDYGNGEVWRCGDYAVSVVQNSEGSYRLTDRTFPSKEPDDADR